LFLKGYDILKKQGRGWEPSLEKDTGPLGYPATTQFEKVDREPPQILAMPGPGTNRGRYNEMKRP